METPVIVTKATICLASDSFYLQSGTQISWPLVIPHNRGKDQSKILGCFSIKTTHQVIDDFQNKRTAGAPSHILSIFQLSLKNITISSFNYVHQERNADMGPLSVIMRHKQEHDTEIFKYVFFFDGVGKRKFSQGGTIL